jgi:dienelactone hydrolase
VVLLVAVAAFAIWALVIPAPMPEALAALVSDDAVAVTTEPWLAFEPVGMEPTTGLILYPGGRVDPRAYAPAARALAEEGYLVVIVPMPLNLAVFGPSLAVEVMAAYPEIEQWAIGGHSLGGAMAARFAYENPGALQGLILWAAYPAPGDDLSEFDLEVASIYGTRDGLATPEKIDASHPLLPESTTWVPIEGGNHAQFGWYGPQGGDNVASIGREQQQAQIVEATLAALEQLSDATP